MLRVYRISNTYRFHSLWFDPTGARTHDRPHSSECVIVIYSALIQLYYGENKIIFNEMMRSALN